MAQSTAPLVLRLLASSVTVANRAGKIIRDIMSRGDLGIIDKGVNDLQTEADRSAQRCIVASLSQQFPEISIIGEEETNNCEVPSDWIVTEQDSSIIAKECPPEYLSLNGEDIVVWVDPLDGTSEYTMGLVEHVTVLIGVSVQGRAVGGVMHQPYFDPSPEGGVANDTSSLGRTIWGLVGLGVGGFVPVRPPEDRLVVTTTRSHFTPTVQRALDGLKPDEVLKVGGAGHKVLKVMEGKAHAYVFASNGCKKWDTCAPEGVLAACGGKLTDIHGRHYSYEKTVEHQNGRGVLATAAGVDHAKLVGQIPQDVKDEFQ